MSKTFDEVDDGLRRFLEAQRVFFVATAPLDRAGHVNLSPKGLDSFRVLDPHTVAYVDFTGSGIETIAHLRENGRIVLMFCAFEGPPKIIRLHGRGEVVEPDDARFAALAAKFPSFASTRAVIVVTLERIADSCGYGVPLYTFRAERTQLGEWAERKGADGIARYQREHNLRSIDGLAGLRHREPS
jgi:predicted pyridoxine 5'-phosphate oxidase superfamily flavin-nucleotide-binding protein